MIPLVTIFRAFGCMSLTSWVSSSFVLSPSKLSHRLFVTNSVKGTGKVPFKKSLILKKSIQNRWTGRKREQKAQATIALTTTELNLVPIRAFRDECIFLSKPDEYRSCFDQYGRYYHNPDKSDTQIEGNNTKQLQCYELGLVEENDLIDVSRFIVQSFGADAISLSQDVSGMERILMKPAVEIVNGYSNIVAFAEVLAGLRGRMKFRLQQHRNKGTSRYGIYMSPPNMIGLDREEQIKMAQSTSIVLAVSKKDPDDPKNWQNSVIATIELRLQPCDAKIPFTLPWLDQIERKLALSVVKDKENIQQYDLQPYLSSLCVDEAYRGRGLGRALVRCVEDIASGTWGYSRMYLHVDIDNLPALELYKSEGYKDVGRRWNPFWAGQASSIGYFVKTIGFDNLDQAEGNVK